MRNAIVTIGAMIVAVPVTLLVLWLGFMLLAVVFRMLLVVRLWLRLGGLLFLCARCWRGGVIECVFV